MRKKVPLIVLATISIALVVTGIALSPGAASVESETPAALQETVESAVEDTKEAPVGDPTIILSDDKDPLVLPVGTATIEISLADEGWIVSWNLGDQDATEIIYDVDVAVAWRGNAPIEFGALLSGASFDINPDSPEGSVVVPFPYPEIGVPNSEDMYLYIVSASVKNGHLYVAEPEILETYIPASIFEPNPPPPPPSVEDLLTDLAGVIEGSEDDAWKKPGDNRKNTMIKKISAVVELLEAGAIDEAINKLEKDLLPKLTGKWLKDAELQAECAAIIDEILVLLVV